MAGHTIAESLLGLPVPFWSIVVTASATLLGALIGIIGTNLGNTKRLKLQLDHDTSEKAKERLAILRRELYLKAVAATVRALAYFGKLPQVDLTEPDSELPVRNLLAVCAKLQLVVSQEVAKLVSDVVSSFGELQMRLMVRVMPIHNLRTEINLRNTQYENAQAEIKRVLAVMTQFNESGQHDTAQFERFNRSFEVASQVSQKAADERLGLYGRMNALHRQYMKDLMPELKCLSELHTRLLVELRRELEVGGDIEIFKQMMQGQIDRMERAVDNFDRELFGPDQEVGSGSL